MASWTPERVVVVSGIARSGTSWVGKALGVGPDVTYHREVDNADHVTGLSTDLRWWYAPDGDDDSEGARHLARALRGEVATPSTTAEDPGVLGRLPRRVADPIGRRLPALYPRRATLLVKLTRANLALGWIADRAPDAAMAHVIRHPCGVFASWTRQGWEPRPQRLLADDRLVAEHLEPHVDTIRKAESFWERAGAYWASIVLVVTRQAVDHPDWRLVPFEWLCADPRERLPRLAESVGLPWTAQASAFVDRADHAGDGPFSLARDTRAQIDRWRSEVEPHEVAACRRVVERFDLPWYPDFDPTGSTPAWSPG